MLSEQLLSFLVGLVDTYLAGHVSKEATVAVGTASYLGWFVMLAFTLVGVGAAALVSRALGAADRATANMGLNQSLLLALATGIAVSVASYSCAPLLAGFLTRTDEAAALTTHYLQIISLCYVLASVNLVGSSVLRSAGDTRTPLRIMTLVNIINIVVAAGLVYGWFGLRMGVTGIAIGALTARSAGGLLMLLVLARGLGPLRMRAALLAPHWQTLRRILRVGIPAAADTGIMTVAQLAFVRIISRTAEGDAGTANYAAHVIAMQIEALSYLPALAWGTAAATMVGQYLGARQEHRAQQAGHAAAMQGVCIGVCAGLTFWFFAESIFSLMTAEPTVRAVGAPAMRLLGFAQPFLCAAIIYITALRGAGDTRSTLAMSIVGGLMLRVPGAYLGGIVLHGGLIGAWCGMWADNVAKCALATGRFMQGGWKRARV
ncbi:MAG: MATE family efflux transporter [Phycisphaerae bacterium]